jgi:hypothetical protein
MSRGPEQSRGSPPGGPWHRLRLGRGAAPSLEPRRVREAMRDLIRTRAVQAAGWRAAGLRVVEVRALVYAREEAGAVVWYLNEAGLALYGIATGEREGHARVAELPGEGLELVFEAVDYHLW